LKKEIWINEKRGFLDWGCYKGKHSQFLMHPGGRILDPIRKFLVKIASPRRHSEDNEFGSGLQRFKEDIFKKETKLTPEEIKKYLTKEYFLMTTSQAMEKGLISEIV